MRRGGRGGGTGWGWGGGGSWGTGRGGGGGGGGGWRRGTRGRGGGGADRGGAPGPEEAPGRLSAVEERPVAPDEVGEPVGGGVPGVAHRVLGDELPAARG